MPRKFAPISPSGSTILLVDDDPEYLEATRRLLEREGHQVLCAADGPTALATLCERPVDLLLLDYFMPGMTGEEVVAQLRQFDAAVQVILQTGYASERPPREMLRRLDIQGYFDKSEGPDKLLLWTEAGLKAARNIQQLNHLHEALKTQRVEEQAILLCLSQALLKETEAQAVMELSVHMTAEALRAPVVGLRLPDRLPDPTCLILRASVGVPSAQAGALRLPLGQGSASGYAFSRGEPLVIEDFEAETRFQVYSLRRQLGVSAGLVAPLIARGKAMGTLGVADVTPRRFSADDLRLLELIANITAQALERAQLFEAEREQRELAQVLREIGEMLSATLDFDAVLDRLLEQVARIVPYDSANIMLVENNQARLARMRGYERFGEEAAHKIAALSFEIEATPNLRRMAETRRPLVIPDKAADPDWIQADVSAHAESGSWAGAPIVVQNQVVAFFALDKVEPDFYRPEHAERLVAFAAQAALAWQNARLYQQAQQQLAELSLLFEVSREIQRADNVEALLPLILGRVLQVMQADAGSLFLRDGTADQLRVAAARGYPAPAENLVIPFGQGLAGRVVLTGETLVSEDLATDARLLRPELFAHLHAGVAVPLAAQEKLIGAILVAYADHRPITANQIQWLTTVVATAASGLHRAQLFDVVRQRLEELTSLHAAATAAAEAGDEDALIERATQIIGETLYPLNFGIILLDATTGDLRVHPSYRDHLSQRRFDVIPAGQGVSGWVAATGQPRHVADVTRDPHYLMGIPETRSELCVPLKAGDRVIGVINAESDQLDAFTEADERLLSTFAGQLATAIEKLRLFSALRESEARYRTLFESNPHPMWVYDLETLAFLAVNASAVKHYGYTREEFLAMTIQDIRLAEDLARLAENLSHPPQKLEHAGVWRHRKKDGSLIEVEIASHALSWDQQPARLVLVNDVTERRQRERQLEVVAALSAALRTAPTRAEMLPTILDQLRDLLKAEGAALALRDAVSGEIVFELGRGAWASWTGFHLPPGGGISGQVIATGQPFRSSNLLEEPHFYQPTLLTGVRAGICLPLATQAETVGVLWVGRQTEVADDELRLLTAIADITANAIRRATLHEQTEQRLQRLTTLRAIDAAITGSLDMRITLKVLLDQLVSQLHVDAADILLLNPHTQTLDYLTGCGFRTKAIEHTCWRLGEGHAGRVALEWRPLSLLGRAQDNDVFTSSPALAGESFVAYCGVPLVAKGQVRGVLEIFHRDPLHPDQDWFDFLETLASQAAIAIDNAQLFDGLQRSNIKLMLAYDTTLEGWSRALDLRDKETEGHTQRVTEMSLKLARAMGQSEAEIVHIRRGALLHDIGKMGIPDSILLKPGKLTDEEWAIMRRHPVYAYEVLSPIAYLRPALDIPYYHHEKWDGTGYPKGLKGEQIPLAARIFAVADVWDALRSDRPYRKGWPEDEIATHIQTHAGTHFDPQVVEVFLRLRNEQR